MIQHIFTSLLTPILLYWVFINSHQCSHSHYPVLNTWQDFNAALWFKVNNTSLEPRKLPVLFQKAFLVLSVKEMNFWKLFRKWSIRGKLKEQIMYFERCIATEICSFVAFMSAEVILNKIEKTIPHCHCQFLNTLFYCWSLSFSSSLIEGNNAAFWTAWKSYATALLEQRLPL